MSARARSNRVLVCRTRNAAFSFSSVGQMFRGLLGLPGGEIGKPDVALLASKEDGWPASQYQLVVMVSQQLGNAGPQVVCLWSRHRLVQGRVAEYHGRGGEYSYAGGSAGQAPEIAGVAADLTEGLDRRFCSPLSARMSPAASCHTSPFRLLTSCCCKPARKSASPASCPVS